MLFEKFSRPENLPAGAATLLKQINFFENVRIYDEPQISLLITENGALFFLRAGDAIDYSQGIFSKSRDFIDSARGIFEIFWAKAQGIKPSELRPP